MTVVATHILSSQIWTPILKGDEMPNFISRKDVLATFDISVWTLRRWQKHRGFPEPISVSGIKKMYIKPEVDAWVLERSIKKAEEKLK